MRTKIAMVVIGLTCLLPVGTASANKYCQSTCRIESCAPMCCSHCGQKSCRVICEMKKVKKTVWVVKCEEFCVPNPSCCRPCCKKSCCTSSCSEQCGTCCGSHGKCGKVLVPPRCGPVRCRKKLIKKEIVCEVPVYKCVVCGSCCEGCCCGEQTVPKFAPEKKAKVAPAPSPTALLPRIITQKK